MTVKEAILHLNYLKDFKTPDQVEALDMAIKALEEPSYNSVKSELDAISRQTVLDMLENINAETEGVGFYYEHYVEYIKKLPTVTPQPKTGHWRPIYQGDEIIGYRCSECEFGRTESIYRANYCHNCGAKMVESQERGEK